MRPARTLRLFACAGALTVAGLGATGSAVVAEGRGGDHGGGDRGFQRVFVFPTATIDCGGVLVVFGSGHEHAGDCGLSGFRENGDFFDGFGGIAVGSGGGVFVSPLPPGGLELGPIGGRFNTPIPNHFDFRTSGESFQGKSNPHAIADFVNARMSQQKQALGHVGAGGQP
jgi:hypothetical protein